MARSVLEYRANFLNNRIIHRISCRRLFYAPLNPPFFFRRLTSMPEFKNMYNRQRKWTFYLLSIYVLGWGFTSYQTIFLGLILGTCCSYFALWHMFFRMKRFDKAISQGKKPLSFGSISRLATAGVAAAIALKYPQYFNIFSMIMGLMTTYVVIMIDYLFQSFHVHK